MAVQTDKIQPSIYANIDYKIMNKKEVIKKTAAHVKSKMEGEGTGHDWWHIERVWNNAKTIAKEENADRLDAIGAMGIARCFAYGGYKNMEIYNPNKKFKANMTKEEYKNNNGSSINHFYEKLLKLKDLMNTKTGKKLAKKRHKFMEKYLEEFYLEWEGKS